MSVNNQELIILLTNLSMADYLGDTNKKLVHDLSNQKENCRIDEIMLVHKRYFIPDTSVQANSEEYTNCVYCIGHLQE